MMERQGRYGGDPRFDYFNRVARFLQLINMVTVRGPSRVRWVCDHERLLRS